MKKRLYSLVLIFTTCFVFFFSLSAFAVNSKEGIKKYTKKVYNGFRRSQIAVHIDDIEMVVENGELIKKPGPKSYIWTLKNGMNKNYYNPKIVEKNGKKYLTADGFTDNIVIIDENTLVCEDDKEEFIYVNLMK